MKTVITLTMNPAVDQNSSTEFVTDEKKLKCRNLSYEPGGGGINVSRALKILGGRAKAFFPSGGSTGDLLEQLLEKEEINHYKIDINNSTRVNVNIIEEATDKQYRFTMPGAELEEGEWRNCLRIIEEYESTPAFIVASGSLPPGVPDDFYKKLANLSKKIGSKLIVDTSKEPLKKVLEEGVFLIKPNLREFSHIIGKHFEDESQILDHAAEIVNQNKTKFLIISLGAAGIYLIQKNQIKHICSPLVPINSRVGAGDSMVAGITLGLAKEYDIEKAARYGVAAGAAAVMTSGTKLCRKDDVERIFKNMIKNKI